MQVLSTTFQAWKKYHGNIVTQYVVTLQYDNVMLHGNVIKQGKMVLSYMATPSVNMVNLLTQLQANIWNASLLIW